MSSRVKQKSRKDWLLELPRRVQDLTRPGAEVSRVDVWRAELGEWETREHRVERPSLLDQLQERIAATAAGGAGSKAVSKPTANLHAIGIQQDIERELDVVMRMPQVRSALESVRIPRTVAGRLQLLAAFAVRFDDATLRSVWHDVGRWHGWIRMEVGYDSKPLIPHVPCMNCEKWDTLRIQFEPDGEDLATCFACGEVWDADRFGLLEWHYRELQNVDVVTLAKRAGVHSVADGKSRASKGGATRRNTGS